MQSIGERLEEARKKKGISLREAAEATKIRGEYLHQLETNKFDLGLTGLYVRGFLRTYALYLKLPAEKILSDFADLGLNDPRPRAINPEVYGRMELAPTATKSGDENRGEPSPAAALTGRPALHRPTASRPTGAFTPPSGAGAADQTMIIKLVAVSVVAVLLIVLLGWGIFSLFSGDKTPPPDKPANPSPTVSQPAVSENTPKLRVFATGPVRVSLQQKSDNKVLFSGTLNRGDVSPFVPRVDTIRVVIEPSQNAEIEIEGKRWPMPSGSTTAEIQPPTR